MDELKPCFGASTILLKSFAEAVGYDEWGGERGRDVVREQEEGTRQAELLIRQSVFAWIRNLSPVSLFAFVFRVEKMADEESTPLLSPDGESEPQGLSHRVKTALSNPASLNGLEKALAALAVFLLLLTATGFGLFAGEAVKLGQEVSPRGELLNGRALTLRLPHSTARPAQPPPSLAPPLPPPQAPSQAQQSPLLLSLLSPARTYAAACCELERGADASSCRGRSASHRRA